ncbi:MAG: hypothetical protein AUI36_23490, partial [Cyanobacteria bacterium 13_1_40CM_2_61_4]
CHGALAALIALGAIIRLVQFLQRPSLSVDEAMLALSIGSRSYGGLVRSLDYDQAAPFLVLWGTRLITRLGGVNAFALRALPLAAGLALPVVMWRVARRLLDEPAALLCAALAACSPFLVRFSIVAKSYEIDAFVAAVLAACALDTAAAPQSPTTWRRLLFAGAAGLAISIPAVFTLAGVGLALVLAPSVRTTPGARWRLAAVAAVWAAAFTPLYFGLYRRAAASPFMQEFWSATFLGPDSPDLPARLWRSAQLEIFPIVVGNKVPVISTVLFSGLAAAGLRAIGRDHARWGLALVAAPITATFAASALHRYPIAARTLLFTAPLLIVILIAGLRWVAALLSRPLEAWTLGGVGAVWVATATVIAVTKPEYAPHVRPLIEEFERTGGGAEPVYVFVGGVPTWTFYTTDWAAPDTARLRAIASAAQPSGPIFRQHREDLVFTYRGRREIIGNATGMRIRYWTGVTPARPDSGWAEHEAARIRAEAQPDVWLFFEAYFREPVVNDLLNALERAGGRRVRARAAWEAKLYQYRFDGRPGP